MTNEYERLLLLLGRITLERLVMPRGDSEELHEAIMNVIEPEPTAALPPDDKRCIQIQDVQRCRNEATDGHKIYCECGHNYGPDPESKPAFPLCFVPDCEALCAPGKVYCHEHYDRIFDKPAPKPPEKTEAEYIEEGRVACAALVDKHMEVIASIEKLTGAVKEAGSKPASTTCPTRVRMKEPERTYFYKKMFKELPESRGGIRAVFDYCVDIVEEHHGIKP